MRHVAILKRAIVAGSNNIGQEVPEPRSWVLWRPADAGNREGSMATRQRLGNMVTHATAQGPK